MTCIYTNDIFIFTQDRKEFCCDSLSNKISYPTNCHIWSKSESPLSDDNIPFAAVRAACKFFNQNPSERSKQNQAIKEALFS